jgi:hypothetical protein
MHVLAAIEAPEVARKILECLDLPARAPPLLPAPAASASHELAASAEEEPPWVFDQRPPEGGDTT